MILLIQLLFLNVLAREPIEANRYEALSGVRIVKDVYHKRNASDFIAPDGQKPFKFLIDNFHYIPAGGKVLKVGMESGLNAIFLARKGYKVLGIDSDLENIKRSRRWAKEFGVRIDSVQAEIEKYFVAENTFDAIVCFRNYSQSTFKKLIRAVKPGGILFFSQNLEQNKMVRTGKLLRRYRGLKIVKYEAAIRFNDYRSSIILER